MKAAYLFLEFYQPTTYLETHSNLSKNQRQYHLPSQTWFMMRFTVSEMRMHISPISSNLFFKHRRTSRHQHLHMSTKTQAPGPHLLNNLQLKIILIHSSSSPPFSNWKKTRTAADLLFPSSKQTNTKKRRKEERIRYIKIMVREQIISILISMMIPYRQGTGEYSHKNFQLDFFILYFH